MLFSALSFPCKMKALLNKSMVFLLLGILSRQIQPSSGACSNWISIDPSKYSQTYVDATSASAAKTRTLGYMPATVKHSGSDDTCVTVRNTTGNGRHYEVNIDSDSGGVCMKVGASGQYSCVQDRGTSCGAVADAETTFYFKCDSCEGGEVTFWYRIVLEQMAEGVSTYNENWCQTRNTDYPSSLKPTAPVAVIPTPPNQTKKGGAMGLSRSGVCSTILTLVSMYLARFLL